jgi:hypothetical protein
VTLWSTALTQPEVAALMAGPIDVAAAGLVAAFTFDTCDSTSVGLNSAAGAVTGTALTAQGARTVVPSMAPSTAACRHT